jgi:hypothetical protein
MQRTATFCSLLSLTLLAAPIQAADTPAEAKAILDKALKAHGGADKLAKHPAGTAKMKGKVEVNGMSIEFTTAFFVQMPGQMKIETEVEVMGNQFTHIQVLNGDKGWTKFMNNTSELDKDQVAELKEQQHARAVASLAPLTGKGFTLAVLGEMKIGDKETVGLQVSHKDRRDVNLYFDKKTGMLVKSETRSKDIMGGDQEFTFETFFSDFKDYNGVQRPTKLVLKRDGKDFGKMELTEYQAHDKLDATTFAKP